LAERLAGATELAAVAGALPATMAAMTAIATVESKLSLIYVLPREKNGKHARFRLSQ
jgi:hypothetical protein